MQSLSKIESELFSKEFCLVQLDPGICCRQRVAEVYSHSFEALKILEGEVPVIGLEQGFKFGPVRAVLEDARVQVAGDGGGG